ncbi:MAG TPA: alkaline phosphatase family protein, partial [Actinomycetota bacterium]|nr:alkaline phosphatase family protein [Actinomycetota bacterium]
MRRVVLAFVAVGLLAASWIAPASAQTPQAPWTLPGATATPPPGAITHLVVIVEENSTFDHIFGWLPTANGHRPGVPVSQAGGREVNMRGFSKLGPDTFTVPPGEEVLSNGPTAARQAYD